MRIAPALPFLLCLAPVALAQGQRLTYEDVGKQILWQGPGPSAMWAADGVHDPATGATKPCGKPVAGADDAAAKPRKIVLVHDGDLWLDEATGRTGRGPRASRTRPCS